MKPSELKAAWLKANLKKGEHYAGILLGNFGEQDYHLILLPGDAEGLTWAKAKEFAKKAGGDLPSRREQSLLFANLKDEFKGTWYWSGEQPASETSYAWFQFFDYGNQLSYHVDRQCRARSVRRLTIGHPERRPICPTELKARGSGHGNAQLTEEQVLAIRERSYRGELGKHLATEYHCSTSLISAIVRGHFWHHVGGPIKPYTTPENPS